MLHSTKLCWNSAHVATRHFRNSSVSRIGTRHMRSCSIQTRLYQPHLRWAWSKTQRPVLPRHVADAEAATSDLQHCWRRVCLPSRQCASTSCSWHSRASAPWDTAVHQSLWQANSRDLNQVDNRVWGMLQERMYRVPICDTDELRKHLVATWADFQQSVADDAVDQWRKKDWKQCIRAEGGHFEHLLWRCLPDIPVATHHNRFFSESPMFGGMQHYLHLDEKVLHFTR